METVDMFPSPKQINLKIIPKYAICKDIVRLKIFERDKVHLEIKALGIATYIQMSVRRTARILIHPRRKSQKNLIAIDKTVVKVKRSSTSVRR
ncbi:MAG: hypothetical protein ABWW66_00160 [Archaeoglobaceae archaeon]